MLSFFKTILFVFLLIPCIPQLLMANGAEVRTVKKPEGLRKENPNSDLTAQDRLLWKSVLNWCDECDQRSLPYRERFGKDESMDDGMDAGLQIFPIGKTQYIVDVQCYMTMRQREHLYYKITEKEDTIESRLLKLEQYDFYPAENEETEGIEEPKREPRGEFVRFTDSLAYGITLAYPLTMSPDLILYHEYRGSGGCGLYTVYDVSGDYARVKEFRARIFCSAESPPIKTWKQYPAQQRAKWRVVPNAQREDWQSSPPQFETRCGWFSYSMSSSISLYDRDGKWDINDKWGYKMQGEWERPIFTPEQKMKTKSRDEYGCMCMDVKVSWQSNRIQEIENTRVQSLDVCRRDPGLKRWKQYFK